MSLSAVVNGVVYTRAKEVRVERSIRNFNGWFTIVSSADELDRFPIRIGDRVQIIAGLTDVLFTGFVERLRIRQDAGTHDIIVSGRDITADLVDSALVTKQFAGPIAFDGLVNRVMQEQGAIYPLDVQVASLGRINETELISGEIGETAFEFLERYARRVQVLMTTSEDGAVSILRGGQAVTGISLQHVPGLPGNNLIMSEIDLNYTNRFNQYSCLSQISPAGQSEGVSTRDLVTQSGSSIDGDIRSSRFHEFKAETAMDSAACGERAKLENNLMQAKAFRYRGVLQGANASLRPNRTIAVRDSICGVRDTLLISDVRFSFKLGSGTTTDVECTLKDAFSVQEAISGDFQGRAGNAEDFVA